MKLVKAFIVYVFHIMSSVISTYIGLLVTDLIEPRLCGYPRRCRIHAGIKFNTILIQNNVNDTNERRLVMHARSGLQKRRQGMQVLHHTRGLAHALPRKHGLRTRTIVWRLEKLKARVRRLGRLTRLPRGRRRGGTHTSQDLFSLSSYYNLSLCPSLSIPTV